MGYHTAIHDLLVNTAVAGEFVAASYSVAHPSVLTEGAAIVPKSVEANEIRAAFGIDERYGREHRLDRQTWVWQLTVRFDQEAILEYFERALYVPLVIVRDPDNGIDRQAWAFLSEAVYEHPPRGGASNGTEVHYRFLVELSPQ